MLKMNTIKKNIKKKDKTGLKPFNSVIQICEVCGKIDAYKGDKHNCNDEIIRQEVRRRKFMEIIFGCLGWMIFIVSTIMFINELINVEVAGVVVSAIFIVLGISLLSYFPVTTTSVITREAMCVNKFQTSDSSIWVAKQCNSYILFSTSEADVYNNFKAYKLIEQAGVNRKGVILSAWHLAISSETL